MRNPFVLGAECAKTAIFPQYQCKDRKAPFQKGQIINAVITKIEDNKATICLTDHTSLALPKDQVAGDIGERVRFEVVKTGARSVALKQLGFAYEQTEKEIRKQLDIAGLKDLMQKSGFVAEEENLLTPKTMQEQQRETDAKAAEAVKRIKRQLSYISNHATSAAIAELVKNGISLEKISIRIVNTVVQGVAEARQAEMAQTPVQAQPKMGEAAVHTGDGHDHAQEQITHKWEEIGRMTDAAVAGLVKSGKPLTIENAYIAKYSAVPVKPAIDDATIGQLMPEIERILARDGIELNQNTIEAAKLLVRHEIPIKHENMEKVIFLRQMADRLDQDTVMEQALALLAQGENPMELDLIKAAGMARASQGDTDKIALGARLETVGKELADIDITPRLIDLYHKQHDVVTLARFLDFVKRNPKEAQPSAPDDLMPDKTLVAQRQMAEMRLRLTTEAARKLAGKGIEIDVLPLRDALAQLRALEEERYSDILTASESEASPRNISRMAELFAHMRRLCPVSALAIQGIAREEVAFTIEGVAAANQKAAAQYQQQAAEPSVKYGDGIAKIEDQFGPVLESQGYEATRENIRALEILTRNGMELNEENLVHIKLIDGKINEIAQRLNPWIAADMIKNGLNPSEMNIDDVLSYIDNYHEAFGENTLDKLAKAIQQMDERQMLSRDERNAVIAIYRMLNSIQKDGDVAAGMIYQAGHALTLGRLLEAAQYRQSRESFEKTISDKDGLVERPEDDGTRLSADSAVGKNGRRAYHDLTIRRFAREADYGTLTQWMAETPGYRNMPLETAVSRLRELRGQREATREGTEAHEAEVFQRRLNALDETAATTIRWMQENRIPMTMAHMETAQAYLREPQGMAKALNRVRDSLAEVKREIGANGKSAFNLEDVILDCSLTSLEQKDGMSAGAVLDAVQAELDTMLTCADMAGLEDIAPVQAARRAAALLRSSGGPIQRMPVLFNDRIAELSFYMVNENLHDGSDANLFITLDAGVLGHVEILLKTEGDEAQAMISADNQAGLAALQASQDHLIQMIQESGYIPASIAFSGMDGNKGSDLPVAPIQAQTQVNWLSMQANQNQFERIV